MARSRDLKVVIAGDADKLEREIKRANGSLDKLGRQTRLTSSISSKGFAALRVGATGAAAGIAGLAVATKSVVNAAIESEKSQAKLSAQLKASGISYAAHRKEIDAVIQKHSQLAGLDDEDLQDAFTNVVRATGSVNTAMRDMALVSDLARGKNMDVAKAGELVAKIHAGSVGPLKRMGIEFVKTTENVDKLKASQDKITPAQLAAAKAADVQANSQRALGLIQDKVKGQAEAYGKTTAGSVDRAKVAFENLQETVGAAVAPTVERAAGSFAKFVTQMQTGRGEGGKFVQSAKRIWESLQPVIRALGDVGKYLISHPRLVIALVSAFAGFKILTTVTRAFKALNLVMTANPIGLVVTALVALGFGLVVAYKKSETFRRVVNGAFAAVKTVATAALRLIVSGLDALAGAWSTMLRGIGHVPGFGWATRAANAIDDARKATRNWVNSLNDVAKDRTFTMTVRQRTVKATNRAEDAGAFTDSPARRLGRAVGGIIPGTGRGDTVPMLGEPGEFVIQRKIVEKFGPTFFTKLNAGEEPQRFTSGGIVARANQMDAMHLPYLWGGGHGGPINRGVDCSGAVSWALGISPRVSGALQSFGLPGPGSPNDTKIYANPVHTFAVFNGRGWGTSRENPGGGPGWLSYNHRSGFTVRHLEDGEGKLSAVGAGTGDSQESVESGKQRLRERQERSGSRLVNSIASKYSKGIRAATSRASAIGGAIESAESSYGRSERFFGQVLGGVAGKFGDEDLGTAGGRGQRTTELQELKKLKTAQLSRMRKRASTLKKAISSSQKQLQALQKARGKAKGAKRAKMGERIRAFEDRLTDLKAELKALGETIADTQLDLSDLDKDIAEVNATPDTAVDAPDVPEVPTGSEVTSQKVGDIDAQERAGILTPEEARRQRESALQNALRGDYGALSERERWEVMAQLRDVQQQATEAVSDLAKDIRDLKASIDTQVAQGNAVMASQLGVVWKALADLTSGQIGYVTAGRSLVAGSGARARY